MVEYRIEGFNAQGAQIEFCYGIRDAKITEISEIRDPGFGDQRGCKYRSIMLNVAGSRGYDESENSNKDDGFEYHVSIPILTRDFDLKRLVSLLGKNSLNELVGLDVQTIWELRKWGGIPSFKGFVRQ